jgi:hypothetical protein
MHARVQSVIGDGSVDGVGTGAGCVARAPSGYGFGVVGVQDACARTRCCLIFCWSVD